MPDEASDRSSDARTLRAQAAVLISQARGQITELQQALGAAPAGSPLQSRLAAAAAAQTSAAIGTLSQSLDAPGGFGICAVVHNVPTHLIQRWMGHSSPTTAAVYLNAVGIEKRLLASRMW